MIVAYITGFVTGVIVATAIAAWLISEVAFKPFR